MSVWSINNKVALRSSLGTGLVVFNYKMALDDISHCRHLAKSSVTLLVVGWHDIINGSINFRNRREIRLQDDTHKTNK